VKVLRELVLGVLGGLFTGAIVGVAEAAWNLWSAGAPDLLAPFYATVLYGALGGKFGLLGGFAGALVAMMAGPLPEPPPPVPGEPPAPRRRAWWEGIGWSLGAIAAFTPLAGYALFVHGKPALYADRPIDTNGWIGFAGVLLGFAAVAFLLGLVAFRSRRGRRIRFALSAGGLLLVAGLTALVAWLAPVADPRSGFATGKSVPAGLEQAPNVLVLYVDTLRPDFLGAYGRKGDPTVAIDALAADGVLFEQAIASAPSSVPSTASLLAGRVVREASTDAVTCAEAQQTRGIATAALVNNHELAEADLARGFDVFHYEAPEYPWRARQSVLALSWYGIVNDLRARFAGAATRVEEIHQPAPIVLADARAFIEQNRSARWSLLVHLMEPHEPYFEHPYLMGDSTAEYNGIAFGKADDANPDAARVDYAKLVYQQEITHVDRKLAELVAWLKGEGLYDNTLIVLTSDHGEEFQEHGGWWHGTTLYDEQIRVPLILKLPGNRHAGTRIPYQVRQHDAFVTAVVAQGVAPDASWEGRDLLADVDTFVAYIPVDVPEPAPIMPEELAAQDQPITISQEDVVEPVPAPDVPSAPPDPCAARLHPLARPAVSETIVRDVRLRSLRKNDWKVVVGETAMLFDLAADPGERENLHGRSDLACGSPHGVRFTEMAAELSHLLPE
jgi:arylsulfatase A-like enzyme